MFSARQALKDSVAAIKAECDFHSLTIDFEGLGSFNDQVLFAKPKEDDVSQRNIIKLAGKASPVCENGHAVKTRRPDWAKIQKLGKKVAYSFGESPFYRVLGLFGF